MIPYQWKYLPLLLQILAAFGLGAVMVLVSWLVRRHRNTAVKLAAYECGIVAVGLFYIVRKGILSWSQDKADL
jgi:NADH-quinone oxidoreductase subunit A